MARRMILEWRNYVLRGNAYYWGYRAIMWSRNTTSKPGAATPELSN